MSAANSTKTAPGRHKTAPGRPFEAGQSGNPSGRPKVPTDIKEAFRVLSYRSVEVLAGLLSSSKEAIRAKAAEVILDRAWGKPAQMQDISLDVVSGLDVRAQVRSILLERDADARRELKDADQHGREE